MKFIDVFHLYIGCKVQWQSELRFVVDDGGIVISNFTLSDAKWLLKQNCKPALFPLSAMTEDQKFKYKLLIYDHRVGRTYDTPESFHYLLSHHFDLFNLIQSGEAIDATTITPNPYDK